MKAMKANSKIALLLAPWLVTVVACSSDSNYDFDASIAQAEADGIAANPPEALFNPDPGAPVLPFPNSIFFSGSTNGLLNIPIPEDADQTLANPQVALNQLDGYSTSSPLVTTVSESLDSDTLIVGDTIRLMEVSVVNNIGVTAVNGEISNRELLEVAESNGQLALVPTVPLKPNTSYLVALTSGITDLDGMPLQPSFVYGLLKSDVALTNPALEPLRLATGSHLAALNAAGIDPADVALTWVFKTQSTRDAIQAVKDTAVSSTLVAANSTLTTAAEAIGGAGLADIWVGALDIPYYQRAVGDDLDPLPALNSFWQNDDGNPTGASMGENAADFLPVKTGDEKIPVLLSVPNATAGDAGSQMPPEGWPVTVFVHGITRSRTDMLAIADRMASVGRAVIAIDMPLHGVPESNGFHASNNPFGPRERTFEIDVIINPDDSEEASAPMPGQDGIADPSGSHFDNLANLANARDNLRQAVVDMFVLRASLGNLQQDGLALDTNNVSFVGHSFGAIVGTTMLSFDNSYTAATLGMPGGGIAQLLAASDQFGPDIEANLAAAGIEPGSADFTQFLTVAQTMIDAGDPINHATTLALDTSTPLHLIEVIGDAVVPNFVATAPLSGTDPLARLLGLNQIDMTSATGGLVKFTAGEHGSLINPAPSPAATQEMQQQMAGFALSRGTDLPVDNTGNVIEPLQ